VIVVILELKLYLKGVMLTHSNCNELV